MPKTLTIKEFIEKATLKHGGKYSYDKSIYIDCRLKIIITCPTHGDFLQTPACHVAGQGCPSCKNEAHKLNLDLFIDRAKIVHSNKYNYELAIYTKSINKLIITCPIHGEFSQIASAHLAGKGCKKCANTLSTNTQSNFIIQAKLKHSNKYDYSKILYVNSVTPINIVCSIHGEFEQTPNSHLSGIGCPKCGIIARTISNRSTNKEFIKKAVALHGNKYNYSLVDYKNNATKVKIICNKCKEVFLQTPMGHLQGSNCWKCGHITVLTRTNWINVCNSKLCIPLIYVIRCFNKNEEFIKIGRTLNPVNRRFSNKNTMPYSYEVIKEIKGSPDFIYDKEIELHRLYKPFSYKPLISFAGKTECFNISILKEMLKQVI